MFGSFGQAVDERMRLILKHVSPRFIYSVAHKAH